MRGREHVEWQDRAWRLLANRGQVAVDAWTVGGMLLGGGYGAVLARTRPLGATGVLGASGLGGALGVAGYCVWRCGMGGGKWDD